MPVPMVGVAMPLEPMTPPLPDMPPVELPEDPMPLLFELDGEAVEGLVMGALVASSVFLLHAPSASKAATATVTKAGLSFDTDMKVTFEKWMVRAVHAGLPTHPLPNLQSISTSRFPHETLPCTLVGGCRFCSGKA